MDVEEHKMNYKINCTKLSPLNKHQKIKCGASNSGSRCCPKCFGWRLGTYSSYWVVLPSLNTKGGA